MSTQVLLDHDLSANARRILENKGADVTIADQTVTLGNGLKEMSLDTVKTFAADAKAAGFSL